ncbi:MAG: hypothetical protein ACRDTU_22905 [Micromonosporaceae bacterium]
MPATLTWARRVLWAQIALTVLAVATVLATPFLLPLLSTSGGPAMVIGFAVATPLLVFGPLLVATGIAGLMAVRRDTWRLGVGLALFAPLALLVAGTVWDLLTRDPYADARVEAESFPGEESLDAYVAASDVMLQVLNAAHLVAMVAFCLAAVAAVLLLRTAPRP